jgi:DNA-binding MarR family transcriptional regulator
MLLVKLRRRMSFLDKQIIGGETNLKLSVCGCLHILGISLLSEWDVLAFVHRHGVSLTNAKQIARLLGYEDSVVEGALDRLVCETLIRRSRPSRGVHFYRLMDIAEAGRRHSLAYLIDVSETRDGRLLLRRQLNSTPPESDSKEQNNRLRPSQ